MMRGNLTPNPFPWEKGNQIVGSSFLSSLSLSEERGLGRGFTERLHPISIATLRALNLSRRDMNRADLSLDK
jgi:hypothetical protein